MSWESNLYLSIAGIAVSATIVWIVVQIGIRYLKELPKQSILKSIEALVLERENEEAMLAVIQDDWRTAQEDLHEAERQRQFLEEAEPRINNLQQEISSLEEQHLKAEEKWQEATEQLNQVREELERQEVSCAEKGEYMEGLVETESSLQKKVEELERSIEEKHGTLKELQDCQEELKRVQEEAHSRERELEKLQAKLPDLRDERDELNAELELQQEERQRLESKLEDLGREQTRLDRGVTGLQQEEEILIDAVQNLRETYTSAGGVSQDHDPREDLWDPVFLDRCDPSGPDHEIQRLDFVANQLRGAEVRVSRRTLNAFHTALKIQQMSPLTVLAGISGTGKSLVPSLYAKCMGIHFLNLPVQPGWSSPQDLFGFYNYIEHKFKATPLARALVQFDTYNRAKWDLPEKNTRFDDQVLLVLLDEMNLARVEYYFSELLSRLETRRSVDIGNLEERNKVEVPLEIGHAIRMVGDEERNFSVSLFPDGNVLFAGTMNEDESTMSLSDKVLDRATVLRFGKPSKMVASQPAMERIREGDPLGFDTWQSWLEEKDVCQEAKEAIETLGGIMASAGSPFGHRVTQSMTSYVANYPDSTAGGQCLAVVDQVEQKILPKLRGKEISTIEGPLNELKKMVDDLGDPELAEEIGKGAGSSEGTFHWAGLDREEE